MKTHASLVSLAEKHGCSLDEYSNGAIYLDAPDGKEFRSCQSRAIVLAAGSSIAHKAYREKLDWDKIHEFALAEINEGFDPA